MRIRRKHAHIYLRINAFRAADLFLPDPRAASRSLSACLIALLNSSKKRSKRKLNTPNPSWDDEIVLPLSIGDFNDLLILEVWNWTKKDRIYLGEVRLTLSEIFAKADKLKTDAQWYKLFLSEQRHEYITGSILVLFEIYDETDKGASLSSGLTAGENTSVSAAVRENRKLKLVEDLLDKFSFSGSSLRGKYQTWLDSLIMPINHLVAENEQGFYTELPANLLSSTSDNSDLESVNDGSDTKDKEPYKQFPLLSSLAPLQAKFLYDSACSASSDSENGGSEYTSGSEALSIDSYNAPNSAFTRKALIKMEKKKKKRLFKKKPKPESHYELRNRNVVGVLFLEIVLCSDLPPIKNFARTSFDMDPFVVVTFGKTTFRTSWKRHSLNPIYNERLAFEILEHELNYDIHFSVIDKEKFSFHDKVGDVKIPIQDLIAIAREHSTFKPEVTRSTSDVLNSGKDNETPGKDIQTSDKNGSVSSKDGCEYFSLQNSNHSASSLGSLTELSHSTNPSISFAEDSNIVKTRRKRLIRRHTSVLYVDTSLFQTLNLKLQLCNEKMREKHKSTLKVRARYLTYESLRRDFWKALIERYTQDEKQTTMDYMELVSFLDSLGCNSSDELVGEIFTSLGRSTWGDETMLFNEVVDALEQHMSRENQNHDVKIFEIEQCPICDKKRLFEKSDLDIITHFAICTSKDWSIVDKLLVSSYVTPQVAARRWFSKVLIKLSYGKYQLGGNSAIILVQDRSTGLVLEEKMSVTVRLGIRLLYKGLDKAKSKRLRSLLRKLSLKQGLKFDSPQLTRDIASFIDFHKLDLSECQIADYAKFTSFNDFFYRKLRNGTRPIEGFGDDRIVVSPADCRTTSFATVDDATSLWIKGRNFSVAKLFNGNFINLERTDLYKPEKCSVGIFRLAPQDYHRFHSPVSGTIGPIKYIEGEYYTVNPMAIRSDLDVYGENVRVIVPIETEHFGTVVLVAVGAMMVGSTILSVEEGEMVGRGDEIGYFKFGGSTILLLFPKNKFVFDLDLLNNSNQCIETLVRVGQSIGHSPELEELKRTKINFDDQPKDFRLNIIRVITGGDVDENTNLNSWESQNIKITVDDVELLRQAADKDSDDEDLGREAVEEAIVEAIRDETGFY